MNQSVMTPFRAAVLLVLSTFTILGGCATPSATAEARAAAGGPVLWAHPGSLEPLYRSSVARFNATHRDQEMTLALWSNDPYKQKLREAFDAANPSGDLPDVFFNWGGGNIRSYAQREQVLDLTPLFESDPAWANRFLPTALEAATFGGRRYGVPMNGLQPIVFFYNREVFAKAAVQPPKTFDDLLASIAKLRAAGVVPISVGGASRWTYLMYAEYLVDRLVGPGAFASVIDGKPDARASEGFRRAAAMIQQLVDAGAFEGRFHEVSYDSGDSSALLTSGRAAMELMGTWMVPNLIDKAPEFVTSGKLGWFAFPSVTGGQGDPRDVVGSPTNYYSIAATSAHRKASLDFLEQIVMDDAYIDWLIGKGEVPPVRGIEKRLAQQPQAEWLSFVYATVVAAPSFQLSWDQSLLPAQADVLLADLDRVFRKQATPEQFAETMVRIGRECSGERSGQPQARR